MYYSVLFLPWNVVWEVKNWNHLGLLVCLCSLDWRSKRHRLISNIVYDFVLDVQDLISICCRNISAIMLEDGANYVEQPHSNIDIKSCVWLHFTDTCDPINTTGISHLKKKSECVCTPHNFHNDVIMCRNCALFMLLSFHINGVLVFGLMYLFIV